MNSVNKTLYIPLYGKAFVSKKGIILRDKMAEKIWNKEGFELKGKSKSKWLAYYMGMRSAVFDNWLRKCMNKDEDAIIIHIGCGMDSRIGRVGTRGHQWYDVDFPEVIDERRRYYRENDEYHMIEADARENVWIEAFPKGKNVIVVMEGVSMYFKFQEITNLFKALSNHFNSVTLLMDCYTVLAAKASKYKNPINDVGVTVVYGIDEPESLTQDTGFEFVREHKMTPKALINQLSGAERVIFKSVFGGAISRKMYRMYEYVKEEKDL